MKDTISLSRAQKLHPSISGEIWALINKAEELLPANVAIRIVQGLRTIEEQNELYAQGRTKPGKIVTNAKGGSSYHNYGLAIDFVLMYDKDGNGTFETVSWDETDPNWMIVVNTFTDAGFTWGGTFSKIHDAPHLEKNFGHNWRDLLARYNKKDFIAGTEYVKI